MSGPEARSANHHHPPGWMSDKTQLLIRKTLFYKVAYTIDIWFIETSYDGVHSNVMDYDEGRSTHLTPVVIHNFLRDVIVSNFSPK